MKECLNCHSKNKEKDLYCRNCGIKLHKNIYYVFINIFTIIIVIAIIFVLTLFIASYMV